MWCIWRERNWRTFENRDKSDDQLLAYFSGSHFDWSRAWGLTSSDSIPTFLSSLLCNQSLLVFLCFCFLFFSFLLFFLFCSPLCILCVVFVLLCFFNIIFLLIKKKKNLGLVIDLYLDKVVVDQYCYFLVFKLIPIFQDLLIRLSHPSLFMYVECINEN